MKKYIMYLLKKWYKLIFHFLFLILIFLLLFNSELKDSDFIKLSIPISLTISICFSLNLSIGYEKHLIEINYELEIENYNLKYVIKTNQFNNIGTINNNYINSSDNELPELTIDLIKYHVDLNFFNLNNGKNKIVFDETFVDTYGGILYGVINYKETVISFDKPFEIEEYIKNAEWVKIQNGHALVEKNKHLIGFKVFNSSDKYLKAFNISVNDEKYKTKYKNFNPILIKPNQEFTIVLLVNNLKIDSNYTLNLCFIHNNKSYIQKLEMTLLNGDLNIPLVLTSPTEIPPQKN